MGYVRGHPRDLGWVVAYVRGPVRAEEKQIALELAEVGDRGGGAIGRAGEPSVVVPAARRCYPASSSAKTAATSFGAEGPVSGQRS